MNRREFLKTTAGVVAGLTVLPVVVDSKECIVESSVMNQMYHLVQELDAEGWKIKTIYCDTGIWDRLHREFGEKDTMYNRGVLGQPRTYFRGYGIRKLELPHSDIIIACEKGFLMIKDWKVDGTTFFKPPVLKRKGEI